MSMVTTIIIISLVLIIIGMVIGFAFYASKSTDEDTNGEDTNGDDTNTNDEDTDTNGENGTSPAITLVKVLDSIEGTYDIIIPDGSGDNRKANLKRVNNKLEFSTFMVRDDNKTVGFIEPVLLEVEWSSSDPDTLKTKETVIDDDKIMVELNKGAIKWEGVISVHERNTQRNLEFRQKKNTVTIINETHINQQSTAEQTQVMYEKNACIVSLPDGLESGRVIMSEPWYLNPDNPLQCYAPAGQQCCNQVSLPDGESGCMIDFEGLDYTQGRERINECVPQPEVEPNEPEPIA